MNFTQTQHILKHNTLYELKSCTDVATFTIMGSYHKQDGVETPREIRKLWELNFESTNSLRIQTRTICASSPFDVITRKIKLRIYVYYIVVCIIVNSSLLKLMIENCYICAASKYT